MPLLRSSCSMDRTADLLHEEGPPFFKRLDGEAASERETLTYPSYEEHAPSRGASSSRLQQRCSSTFPVLVLTFLAVAHLLLLCFQDRYSRRWLKKTGRSLAGGDDRPCQLSSETDNREAGGELQTGLSDKYSQHPLGFTNSDTHLQAYTVEQAPLSRWPTETASVQVQASHNWHAGGAGGHPTQHFCEGRVGAHLPSYEEGFWARPAEFTLAVAEHTAASSQGTLAEGGAYGASSQPFLPCSSPVTALTASVQGQQSDGVRAEGTGEPPMGIFFEGGPAAHLPSNGGGNWPLSKGPTQGVSQRSAASNQGTPAEGRTNAALGQLLPPSPCMRTLDPMCLLETHLTSSIFSAVDWEGQHAGGGQAVEGREAGLDGQPFPAAVTAGVVNLFSQLTDAVTKCGSLLPRLSAHHALRLTWLVLRLATLDMAALARVSSDMKVHRDQLGNALQDLALKLLLYSKSIGVQSTTFIVQLTMFAQLIRDIQGTWGTPVSLPRGKSIQQIEANLAISTGALKHYGAVLEGLVRLTELLRGKPPAVVVEQQLRVLEALCNIRSIQVARETASRRLIFFFQRLRQSRLLIDIGFMTPEHKRLQPLAVALHELEHAVASAGGIFVPPQRHPHGGQTRSERASSRPRREATEKPYDASDTEQTYRRRVSVPEYPHPPQLQSLPTLERGTTSRASAGLGETATEQETHESQSSTPLASQSYSEQTKRWSKQRHRNAHATRVARESPPPRSSNS